MKRSRCQTRIRTKSRGFMRSQKRTLMAKLWDLGQGSFTVACDFAATPDADQTVGTVFRKLDDDRVIVRMGG